MATSALSQRARLRNAQLASKTMDWQVLLGVVSHHITILECTGRDMAGSGSGNKRLARKAITMFSDVVPIEAAHRDTKHLESMACKLA